MVERARKKYVRKRVKRPLTDAEELFIRHIATEGSFAGAAARMGWSPELAYQRRKKNPVFEKAAKDALAVARDGEEGRKVVAVKRREVFAAPKILVRDVARSTASDVRKVFELLGGAEKLFQYVEGVGFEGTDKAKQKECDRRYQWLMEKMVKQLYQGSRSDEGGGSEKVDRRTIEQLVQVVSSQREQLEALAVELPGLRTVMGKVVEIAPAPQVCKQSAGRSEQ